VTVGRAFCPPLEFGALPAEINPAPASSLNASKVDAIQLHESESAHQGLSSGQQFTAYFA
jgi:hypothetical protein